MIHSCYLDFLFTPETLRATLERAVKTLSTLQFDAIAVTGNSGTIIAGALSLALNKPLILIRKRNEPSHASGDYYLAEGDTTKATYVIVDDFSATGATIKRVRETLLGRQHFSHMKYVGFYSYKWDQFEERKET